MIFSIAHGSKDINRIHDILNISTTLLGIGGTLLLEDGDSILLIKVPCSALTL